jgi:hypothetical protein
MPACSFACASGSYFLVLLGESLRPFVSVRYQCKEGNAPAVSAERFDLLTSKLSPSARPEYRETDAGSSVRIGTTRAAIWLASCEPSAQPRQVGGVAVRNRRNRNWVIDTNLGHNRRNVRLSRTATILRQLPPIPKHRKQHRIEQQLSQSSSPFADPRTG